MLNDLYNSLLNATQDVFQMMLDVSDISEIPKEEYTYEEALNISIGIKGDFNGEIIYKFPVDTSLKVVNIMSGMDFASVDEFVTSAVSEIANIISGNFVNLLASTDVECDISPPSINDKIEEGNYDLKSDFCLTTSAGEMCFDIRLNS